MTIDDEEFDSISKYLIEFLNLTNNFSSLNYTSSNNTIYFSTSNQNEFLFKKITENIFNLSFKESRLEPLILSIILITFSIVGSISNLFVIFIFNINFHKKRFFNSYYHQTHNHHHHNHSILHQNLASLRSKSANHSFSVNSTSNYVNENGCKNSKRANKKRRQSSPPIKSLLNVCIRTENEVDENETCNNTALPIIKSDTLSCNTPAKQPNVESIINLDSINNEIHDKKNRRVTLSAITTTIEASSPRSINKLTVMPPDFNNRKLIYNTNLKLFYTLIRYLAIIDLFTCSVAIPVTVYEIWYSNKTNEVLCKIFELFRATGVLASNFVIILIAIERYTALYKLNIQKFKIKIFKLRLFFVILLSLLFGIFDMLQVSVYQRINNKNIYIGICLPSETLFNYNVSKILKIFLTCLFILGSLFVSVFYILIFKRTFELNKNRKLRKQREYEIFKNARSNSQSQTSSTTITRINKKIKAERGLNGSNSNKNESINSGLSFTFSISHNKQKQKSIFKRYICCCLHLNRNLRIACMVLLVTFVYYLSVIPFCLTINSFIKYNPFIYYTFLLNNTINPLIYGFFNPYFRHCCIYLIKYILSSMSSKVYGLVHHNSNNSNH